MDGRLVAEYKGDRRFCQVQGQNSLELTIDAITKIMDRASDSNIWAKGRIELRDKTGKILKTMPKKENKKNAKTFSGVA